MTPNPKGPTTMTIEQRDQLPRTTRPLKELAREALAVQDACNLSGVVHGFSRAMTDLRANSPELGTDALNHHPIAVLWADKVAHLTGTQAQWPSGAVTDAYRWASATAEGKAVR